jgi:hypothetical protein
MLAMVQAPPGARLEISPEPATDCTCGSSWQSAYLPTKTVWKPGGTRRVAYQFDGKSSAHIKNPSPAEIELLHEWARRQDLPLVKVGLPLTMEESAAILADSTCFIGCCSGMSTLALAVGIPTYVLEYELKVAWWYGPNPVRICPGMRVFTDAFEANHAR